MHSLDASIPALSRANTVAGAELISSPLQGRKPSWALHGRSGQPSSLGAAVWRAKKSCSNTSPSVAAELWPPPEPLPGHLKCPEFGSRARPEWQSPPDRSQDRILDVTSLCKGLSWRSFLPPPAQASEKLGDGATCCYQNHSGNCAALCPTACFGTDSSGRSIRLCLC